jgi:CheY-like chemotaxis protein
MKELLLSKEFWTSITSLAWPAIALFALYQFKPILESILKRENMTIKIAGMEISVRDAAENLGKQITDIQERMSKIETNGSQLNPAKSIEPLPISIQQKGSKNHLLWVDDYPSNNAFLIDKMRENGIEVTLSLSTADALRKIENNSFDAVITDLGRKEDGGENPFAGLDLIKGLSSKATELPILVFAGHRGLENESKLVSAGASAVTASGIDVMKFVDQHLKS